MVDWKDEVARLDIADVAEKLGLQLAPGRRTPRVALCPFHEDSTPSLRLYQDDAPHYHCFTCQAHGDTVELVKQRLHVDFAEALDWLNVNFGVAAGRGDLRRAKGQRDIRRQALEFWREADDGHTLRAFAQARRFPVARLRESGLVAGSVEAFLGSLRDNREAQDDAVVAGLAHPADTTVAIGLRSVSLSPFARGTRIFIPLADLRSRVVGVMARQLAGTGPKYLFTTGFKKSDVLYRGDHVRRQIEQRKGMGALDGAAERFDLCICEGVFDALRLEAAGIAAVATLGASISDKQLELIADLAREALEAGAILRVHLFYDADKGGRRGAADSVPRLLKTGAEADFLIDIVGVDRPPEEKSDPDILLAGLSAPEAAGFVAGHLISPIDALAAISLDREFAEAPAVIANLDPAGSIMLQNRLARRFQGLDWPKVWRKLAPDRTTLSTEPAPHSAILSQTYERLARAGEQADGSAAVDRVLPEPFTTLARESDASLIHALILARESTDSREYPVDVAAWDRIEEGAQLFMPLVADALARPTAPKRPYLAHFEAKDSGAPRLKCGPCAEDAIQQQYVLSELLRVRPDRRDIAERIPAVRYWADHPGLVVTGAGAPRTAVSFAYQIDMRALEERPDRTRRRDMFRPFLDCWNSFILHIGNRIDRMRCDLIYIARLDVKGFYDHIPRHAVERVLREALPEADTLDTVSIAPLFGANIDGDRREHLIGWILDHSFGAPDMGYAYAMPGSGDPARRGGAKGLPQGPALSSYLANVVLFGLDADLDRRVQALDDAAAAEHGSKACGGLYARYVDDIVIAARSPEELRALRSAIEARLDPLGLELNEKSEHLEPMTAEEARNWVVERRGAGFMAYGDVDDQPSPAPDIRTGWSDIPTLDRRTALSLLYWSALDDPEQTPRNEFEEMLDKVARADALRATDLGHIARRIALRAALDALADPAGPDAPVTRFESHFLKLFAGVRAALTPLRLRAKPSDLPVAEALANARDFLATLTGLERLILGNPEANPTFTPAVREAIKSARTALLDWMLNDDLLVGLQAALIPVEAREGVQLQLGAQIEIQRAALEERAARTLRLRTSGVSGAVPITRRSKGQMPKKPSASGIRIGWLRTFAPDGLANLGETHPTFLFHIIAAEVQAAGGRLTPAAGPDDLPPEAVTDGMKLAAETALSALQDPNQAGARDIATAFRALAGHDEDMAPDLRMRAISAFLGLSNGPLQTIALGQRPALIAIVAPGAAIIPLPPIPGQPGLFCYHQADHSVQALIVDDQFDAAQLPQDLVWSPAPAVGGLNRWSAPLSGDMTFLLDPHKKTCVIDPELGAIADVFDGLVKRHARRAEHTALVHVFALIGPRHRSAEGEAAHYFSLSWTAPRAASEQLVFERRGDGIATQRSPHAGAELWRIGQAVSDLFAISDGDDEGGLKLDRVLLQERLKRMAFSRLRGRWVNGAQVAAALAANEVPRSLTRIINALRETSGSDQGVGPLALEFLLSGRAMRNRMHLGSAVEVPGGWARYLEVVGTRTLTGGDDEGLFSRAAVRDGLPRTSRALVRAADSISTWADRAEAERCRQVLQATAIGFEIAALRGEVRDMALAALTKMSAWDLERLARVRPDLAALSATGQAVLVEPRFGGPDARAAAYDLDRQAEALFTNLLHAIDQRAHSGRVALERITTIGWLTILGVMSGVIDFDMATLENETAPPARPAFSPLADTSAATPLRALAIALLQITPGESADDPDAWPWEVSDTLDAAGLRLAMTQTRAALGAIAKAMGLVLVRDPAPLRMLNLADQDSELITAEGNTYRLAWWRFNLATAGAERQDRAETAPAPDQRLVRPYSAILDSRGHPLVIQLLSENLATLAGLRETLAELSLPPATRPDTAILPATPLDPELGPPLPEERAVYSADPRRVPNHQGRHRRRPEAAGSAGWQGGVSASIRPGRNAA
jgi:DNA primase catalytic core